MTYLARSFVTAAVRSGAAIVLIVTLVSAGPNDVSPIRSKRSCKLITDAKGDATSVYVLSDQDYAPNNPALDVLSADIAATDVTFGAVVRVDELSDLAVDPASPLGHQWFILFSVESRTFYIDARSTPTGTSFYLYEQNEGIEGLLPGAPVGALSGVVDRTKDEVRIWGPLTLLGPSDEVRQGTEIYAPEALSARLGGIAVGGSRDTPWFSLHADFTATGHSYTIGSRSCFKVGR